MYILESKTVFVEQPWRTPTFFCNMMFSVSFWVSVGAALNTSGSKSRYPQVQQHGWLTHIRAQRHARNFFFRKVLAACKNRTIPWYTALSFRATEATTAKSNVSNKGLKFPKSFIYIYLFMLKHVSSTKFLGHCRNLPIDEIKFCYFGSAILTFWPNFFGKTLRQETPTRHCLL